MNKTLIKLDKALNDINAKIEKLDKGISKKMTFEEAIKEVFERPEVKAAIESKSFKDGLSLELKVATTDVTGGTASVSLIDNEKIFAVSRPLAFVGQLPTTQVGNNKNRVVWIEGAYTSNAGYVGEGAYRDWETDRKSTRLNSSHSAKSRMPSSA